ncbi:MAG: DUF952 domain-containing protein [Cyanobium sp.]
MALQGTLLLAPEGINGTLCGRDAALETFLERLRRIPGVEELPVRRSRSALMPFSRLRVRRKREIVTMGRPELQAFLTDPPGTAVPPAAWNALLEDPTTLVIDARNHHEVAQGSFTGAIDPMLERFGDFPAWVETTLAPLVAEHRPRAIALFCTGGIRCEKATAWLRRCGFGGVHQLEGGILRYFEEVPEAHSRWQGECVVFDDRQALNHRLEARAAGAGSGPWLYHLALRQEWHACRGQPSYRRSTRGRSLAEVGFIHLCHPHQLAATHGRFYADLPPGAVLQLEIDPARLAAAGLVVREEPAPGSGELFPHLYGPLPRAAVRRVEAWR